MKKIKILFFVFFISGCTSLSPPVTLKPQDTQKIWSLFWNNQIRKRQVTQAIQGKIHLEMRDKKQSLSGVGSFYSDNQGMRLELRDPLGRTQFISILKGKKLFAAYYPAQKTVYFDGSQGQNYLSEFLGLKINFYELRDLWLGILPFSRAEAKLEQMSPTQAEGQSLVLIKARGLDLEALIESESGEILNLRWKASGMIADFEFAEFARCCEEQLSQNELPRIARSTFLKVEEQKSELDLEWEQIIPAIKNTEGIFSLKIPRGTKRILLK